VTDRALLRAIHFFQDNDRVRLQSDALRRQDFDAFLTLVTASGASSRTQLQNIYSPSFPDEQSLALALSVSEKILAGRGACRVHGGGFAGTIQAFVPLDLVDDYLNVMRALFGPDAPSRMRVRPLGSVALNPGP